MSVRFDAALRDALELLRTRKDQLAGAGRIVIVRDLLGRIRLAFEHALVLPADIEGELREAAGPFFVPEVLIQTEMLAPDAVFSSPDLIRVSEVPPIDLLERVVMGADWSRVPLPNVTPTPPRATLYGIKGGVGRSTALTAWARYLANLGQRVLVIDLDLESPGVSSSLMPAEAPPDFGIVDWLVEDAVNNADEELMRRMIAASPLATGTNGDILVVTCGNASTGTYLEKLARAYLDVPSAGPDQGVRSFAERIGRLVDEVEREVNPTVVLIDSRAGLHDLAGIATTRLGAMTFLFAVGSRQTWDGYWTLFSHWARRSDIAKEVRDRVKMVAAHVPESGTEAYLDRFINDAYETFAETIYEEAGPENPEAFNFDVRSTDAPHYPLRIDWSRRLQDWDPLGTEVTDEHLNAAMGSFLEAATELVLNDLNGIGDVSDPPD